MTEVRDVNTHTSLAKPAKGTEFEAFMMTSNSNPNEWVSSANQDRDHARRADIATYAGHGKDITRSADWRVPGATLRGFHRPPCETVLSNVPDPPDRTLPQSRSRTSRWTA